MKNALVIIISFIASLCAYGIGGTADVSWKNVTIDGRRTAVFCTARDSRGLLWAGTNGGLFFYDGNTARAMARDVLGGVQIYSIAEHGGKLYLGTNQGLAAMDSVGIVQWLTRTPKEIRALMADGGAPGTLWIASLEGVRRYDTATDSLSAPIAGLPHTSAYTLLRDSRGIIYVGTYGGPARYDSTSDAFVPLKVVAGGRHFPTLFANTLVESADGSEIYMGTEGALFRYTPATDSWRRIPALDSYTVKSLARHADGRLVAGTDDGVIVLDAGGKMAAHYRHDSRRDQSLADNEIWTVALDDEENILVGHERGISIASTADAIRSVRLGSLTNSGEGNDIYVIKRDSHGNLWLGGSNGIIRIDAQGATQWYRHTGASSDLSHKRIRSIMESRDGNMWFATDGGINRLRRNSRDFDVYHLTDSAGSRISNWVYSLSEDTTGIWAGSFLGGMMHAPTHAFGTTGTIIADRSINSANTPVMANDLINEVVADGNGNIWVLLYRHGKLVRLRPADDSPATATAEVDIRALTGENPTHLCLDSNKRVWVAYKGGIVIIDKNLNTKLVHIADTGNDESAMAIAAIGNDVWLSTLSSMWRIDGNTLKPKLLPIPQKAYTAIYDDGGTALLGTADEIIAVNVGRLDAMPTNKPISFILSNNDDGTPDFNGSGLAKGFDIPYGGSLSLQVSDLDYSPERVHRYMYRLADNAADSVGAWVVLPEGANTIAFSDIKPGRYSLLIRSAGSTAPLLAVPVHVRWSRALSWWAISIYIILLIAVAGTIVWYVRRRSRRAAIERERAAALENVERKLAFLSTISHDLKTPLSLILGPASILREQAADADSRRALDTIYDNAVRLNGMIHRTLELQHLEDADSSMLIPTTFDVVEFSRSIFEVFREANSQKNFVFTAPPQRIAVETDAVKLESVLTNLLSNACKYSDDGATISMGVACHDDKVEVIVADGGVGIADIDQPLVFQRSFRAPATAGVKEGTGLGLFLIKKYLELMGGTIELYSRQGQGSAFIVTLPRTEKELQVSPQEIPVNANKPKILIVEDNIQISNFLKTILGNDYTCLTADNGRAGLTIASSFEPDIIIADEMMPIMGGMEMVRRLKQNPRLQDIPIIMLTAKSDSSTEAESVSAGVDVFMAKPFEPEVLTGRVRRLLAAYAQMRRRMRAHAITDAEARPIEAETPVEKQLAAIARVIEENISDPDLNVNMLCAKTGIANKQLYRILKKYMGVAPLDYIRTVRLQKAAALLAQHRFTVSEVCYMTGFNTPSYFARCFREQYGCNPAKYTADESWT